MQQHCNTDVFLEKIEACRGIIHKITFLYADGREDREDLFQEILYQSCRSFPHFRSDSSFSTWLYRVALNTALVFKRNQHKIKSKMTDEHLETLADETVFYDHKKAALIEAIKSLPKVERMIITLHLEGYANREVADIAGISTAHTAVKIHRIKKLLTKKIKEEY